MAYVMPEYHGGKNQPEQVTDEYLTCTICKIPGFRQPKILQCGHVFCLKCLESYWCTAPNGMIPTPGNSRPPYSGKHGRRPHENPCRECGMDRVGMVPTDTGCPLCGQVVPIPSGGLHALPNYIFGTTQEDRLLRRANRFPMPAIDDRRLYNISEYNHYGHTKTASLNLTQPQWHGWNIAK